MNVIAPFPVKDTWLAQCISENGKALPIVTNALVALRRDPAIRDAFAFDEMQRTPMMMHSIGDPLASFGWRAVTDDDITLTTEWMQKAGLKRIAGETVRNAVNLRARENAFHPVCVVAELGLGWPEARQRLDDDQARRGDDAVHPGDRPDVPDLAGRSDIRTGM
jgi:hypothetical protein